jgi:GGDEF domain-containing protein
VTSVGHFSVGGSSFAGRPADWSGVTDRRILVAAGGALVGLVGGIAAAANGAPVPGVAAAVGALVAAAGVLWSPADPRDAGPSAVSTGTSAPAPAPAPSPAVDITTSPVSPPVPVTVAGSPAPPPAFDAPLPPAEPPLRLFAPPDEPERAADDGPSAPTDSSDEGSGQPPLLTDPTTGLFSEDYFNIAIEARLAAARRHLRPVGVVLLEVVEGLRVDRIRATDPGRVAEAVRETLREADTACRRPDGKFALLLEDTPENGAIWTVERIRRRLVDADASLTVWAGIACYPAHAFDKDSILRAADVALVAAREWRQDRIEVAAGD